MLHYNPRHVSSINMPIFRRTNCIITASGIVTLCKRLYIMPDESRLCRVCSHPAYCTAVAQWLRHCATSRTVPGSNLGAVGRRDFSRGYRQNHVPWGRLSL